VSSRLVLVVEDDTPIRRGLVDALSFHGYTPIEAADGAAGVQSATMRPVDLVLLDLMLPRQNGLDVLRAVRDVRPTLPIIILTARGEEDDRVAGLRLGADDYVVKPFSVKELLARIEAVLRRSPERPAPLAEASFDGGVIDLARREAVFADGSRIELSQREVELAGYLAANAGRAISREELLTRLWQLDPSGLETRTIDMHVARLREKLADPQAIQTVRGRGYMWRAVPVASR
jgi:DNA-binding response OmpR family regulator